MVMRHHPSMGWTPLRSCDPSGFRINSAPSSAFGDAVRRGRTRGAMRRHDVRDSSPRAAADPLRDESCRKAGSPARRVGPPPSRPGDGEGIDERLAPFTGLIDPGESQLVAPARLCCASAAKSETLIMPFGSIKGPRLPGSFNRVPGATGHGSFHGGPARPVLLLANVAIAQQVALTPRG